jgi:CubicO group peptidase (beta-lactamase class C family)
MGRIKQLLITIPVIAATSSGGALAQDFRRIPTLDIRQASPQQLRQRFPAQEQARPRPYKLRPGGAAGWIDQRRIRISVEAITVSKIADEIKTRFTDKAVGWSVTVMGAGGATASVAGGAARRAPDSAPRAMSDKERISIASVSKTITAATMMRVMPQKNVKLGDKAYLQLPSDWTFDPKFKEVTIQQLMGHTSGIWDENCGIDLATLKACAAKAPQADKSFHYANTNYALQRLMLVRMYGLSTTTAEEYGNQYVTIVNRQTFNSAGLPFLTCKSPQPNPALSYKSAKDDGATDFHANNFDFSTVLPGQDWGDMTAVCGSQGWNLNSRELAWFMHDLMLTAKILPQTAVDEMRAANLGMFYADYGGGLTAYYHGGWHPAGWNKGEINTLIITYSNGITIGAVINSRYNGDYGGDLAAAVKAVLP